MGRSSAHPERRSSGRRILLTGGRGSQAALDSRRSREKARKASLTKSHSLRMQKRKLLDGFVRQSASESEAFVAPEMQALTKPSGDRQVTANVDLRVSTRVDTASNLSSSTPTRQESPSKNPGGREIEAVQNQIGVEVEQQSSITCNLTKELGVTARGRHQKRFHLPYKKELKIAKARAAEKAAKDAELERSKEEHSERRRVSTASRRKKSMLHRKVTRKGQPKLKYQIDALLESLGTDHSTGVPSFAE